MEIEKSGKRIFSKKGKKGAKRKRYSFEFKSRAVSLYLEEGYPAKFIAEEMGMSDAQLYKWARKYRAYGDDGLRDQIRRGPQSRKCSGINEKIIDLKQRNPGFGSRRISDILKRFFLLKASTTTVHTTLRGANLTTPPPVKRKKNPGKPRFFERATPNQLWQSDICTFRLGGKNAYLLGFIDDYSRYITGLGLYRSQTAENLLEVYRLATGEYGVPKEVLTDNGRQYTNWRGTTRFERELKKDKVKHIKSRPHHPMTLGKIERFWKTILDEFLFRAQFGSFEEARERLSLWVKYYNHKRPHQGIGGLCPADRFFEIQHALRKTLERGMQENMLELALRGKPRDPFYMVGRMGGQSVVIRAEKGKVKMLVDGQDKDLGKELVYDMKGKDENDATQPDAETIMQPAGTTDAAAAPAQLPGGETEAAAVEHPAAEIPEYAIALEHWYGETVEEETAEEEAAEHAGPGAGADHHEGSLRADDGY
ncbi:IS481 family transposase [Thermodesulfobacteriota bacterium]